MNSLRHLARAMLSAAALFGVLAGGAHAQVGQQPYKILVGFAPGGSLDSIARMIAEKMKEPLGHTLIVDNRPGAGGRIAVDLLKSSPADGSVAMMCPDFLATIYPLVYSKLNYDPDADMVLASTVAESPMAFAVSAAASPQTLPQYVEWAKANPNQANFGHGALGGPTYLLGLMIGKEFGLQMRDVPFSGAAAMLPNLVGNQFSAGTSYVGDFAEYHKSGKIRILATSGTQRSPSIPDVPTFAELGYKNLTAASIYSVCLPKNTPAAVVQKWSSAVAAAVADKEVADKIARLSFTAGTSTPAEGQQRYKALRGFWEPVVKASGFKAD